MNHPTVHVYEWKGRWVARGCGALVFGEDAHGAFWSWLSKFRVRSRRRRLALS